MWQERPLMVRWVVGSIPHGGPNDGTYKTNLLLIGNSSPCGGSGLLLSLPK